MKRRYGDSYQLWVGDEFGRTYEASWSNKSGEDMTWLRPGVKLDIIYSIKVKRYAGVSTLTLETKSLLQSS